MPFWWKSKTGFNLALKKVCEKNFSFSNFFQIFIKGLKAFFILRTIIYREKFAFNLPIFFFRFFLKIFLSIDLNNLYPKEREKGSNLKRIFDFVFKNKLEKNFENPIEIFFRLRQEKKHAEKNFSNFLFFNSTIFLKNKKTRKILPSQIFVRIENFKKKNIYPKLIFIFWEKLFSNFYLFSDLRIDLILLLKKYVFRILKTKFFVKEIIFLKFFKHFFIWLDNKWNQKRLFALSILEKFLIQEFKKKKFVWKTRSKKFFSSSKNIKFFRNFQKSPASKRCIKIGIVKLGFLLRDFFFLIRRKSQSFFKKIISGKQFCEKIFFFMFRKINGFDYKNENLLSVIEPSFKKKNLFFNKFVSSSANFFFLFTQNKILKVLKILNQNFQTFLEDRDKIFVNLKDFFFCVRNKYLQKNLQKIIYEEEIKLHQSFFENYHKPINYLKISDAYFLKLGKIFPNSLAFFFFEALIGPYFLTNFGHTKSPCKVISLLPLFRECKNKQKFFSRSLSSFYLNLSGWELKKFRFSISFKKTLKDRNEILQSVKFFFKKNKKIKNFLRKQTFSFLFEIVSENFPLVKNQLIYCLKKNVFKNPIVNVIETINMLKTYFSNIFDGELICEKNSKLIQNHWVFLSISRILINNSKKEKKFWFSYWESIAFEFSKFCTNPFLFFFRILEEMSFKIDNSYFKNDSVIKKNFRDKSFLLMNFFLISCNKKIFFEKIYLNLKEENPFENGIPNLNKKKNFKLLINKIEKKKKKIFIDFFLENITWSDFPGNREKNIIYGSALIKLVCSHQEISQKFFKFLIFCFSKFSDEEILSEIIIFFKEMCNVFPNKISEHFKEICDILSFKHYKSTKNGLSFFFHIIFRGLFKPKRECLDLIFDTSYKNLEFFRLKKNFLSHLLSAQKNWKINFYFELASNLIKVQNAPEIIFKIFLSTAEEFFICMTRKENLLEKFLFLFRIFKKKNEQKKILLIISTFFQNESEIKKINLFFSKNSFLFYDIRIKDEIYNIFFKRVGYFNLKKNLINSLENLTLNNN